PRDVADQEQAGDGESSHGVLGPVWVLWTVHRRSQPRDRERCKGVPAGHASTIFVGWVSEARPANRRLSWWIALRVPILQVCSFEAFRELADGVLSFVAFGDGDSRWQEPARHCLSQGLAVAVDRVDDKACGGRRRQHLRQVEAAESVEGEQVRGD